MTLADERRSRRFRSRPIDPLTFRVFLALLGTLFLVVMGLGISRGTADLEWWGWVMLIALLSTGSALICAALFSSDQNAEKWSDAASSHEVAALLILVAFPIAWAIRKVFPT
jgi:hypothetical protein